MAYREITPSPNAMFAVESSDLLIDSLLEQC